MDKRTDELKKRIADLESALEEYTDKESIAKLLLAGDNYDRCDRCQAVLPTSELRRVSYRQGDDVEVRLFCEHC